jgi:hypothetical protein
MMQAPVGSAIRPPTLLIALRNRADRLSQALKPGWGPADELKEDTLGSQAAPPALRLGVPRVGVRSSL